LLYSCKLLMHHQPLYSHINPSPKSRSSLSLSSVQDWKWEIRERDHGNF
jgi:hypothetical protein